MATTSEAEREYREDFGLNMSSDDVESKKEDRAKAALEQALQVRQFEIELYWKRASYFWLLIAAAFTGYFAVFAVESKGLQDGKFNAFVIATIGFVFSWAWFLVNRGSKFWQENWENHVSMLEDSDLGPLYKTILRRPPPKCTLKGLIERLVDGPMEISVSKVNQWVSLFTMLIWVPLGLNAWPSAQVQNLIEGFDDKKYWIVFVLSVTFFVLILKYARSHLKGQYPVMKKIPVQISGRDES